MRELLPMLLSVTLFIITLIVIATLRKADQKYRKVELIKKYVNQFNEKMKNTADEMNTTIVEVNSKLEEARENTAVAITQITHEKEELFSHLKDLQELQATIVQYHTVLSDLSSMTESVEDRLNVVKEDMNEIQKVETLIADFSVSIQDSHDVMDTMQQSLHQSIGVYQTKIEDLIESSIEQLSHSFEEKKDEFVLSTNPLLTQMNSLVSALFNEVSLQVEKVEQEISFLHKAKDSALEELKQHILDSEKDLEIQKSSLDELQKERTHLSELVARLHGEEQQVSEMLERKKKEITYSDEHLEEAQQNIASSKEEFENIRQEVMSSKEQLTHLEDEIAEALKIKEELQKEEELASLLEREKIDYPNFDEEDEVVDEIIDEEIDEEDLQDTLFDSSFFIDEFDNEFSVQEQDDVESDETFEMIEEDYQEQDLDEYEQEGWESNTNFLDIEEDIEEVQLYDYEEDFEEFEEVEKVEEILEVEEEEKKKKDQVIHEHIIHDKEDDEEEIFIDEEDE